MSDSESEVKFCKNCEHKLESHLNESGKCAGEGDKDHPWCIANCQRFWE